MIFKRNRKGRQESGSRHVMRGRETAGNGRPSDAAGENNPLAQRFHPDDEPDTIDLTQSADLPASDGDRSEESMTRDLSGADSAETGLTPAVGFKLITYVPQTGKFYLQPGTDANAVRLAGSPVDAPTELRYGDLIEVGDSELLLRPARQPTEKD